MCRNIKTYLWRICSISFFRHASIHIGVSGRLAVEAGVDSWVVIPLIPHEAFPFHLPSLDIDPAADETVPVSLYHAGGHSGCNALQAIKKSSSFDTLASAMHIQW